MDSIIEDVVNIITGGGVRRARNILEGSESASNELGREEDVVIEEFVAVRMKTRNLR